MNIAVPSTTRTAHGGERAAAPAQNLSSFIWSVADLLRGEYKPADYGKVILPFTVLRRLDCVLEPTKGAVLAELDKRTTAGINPESFLTKAAGQSYYNTSKLDLKKLLGDQDHIAENLRAYLAAFSPSVRDIFERFEFHTQIDKLDKTNLLYMVAEKFANIDLHPNVVTNTKMGSVFEELIRRFSELANEMAGEHFTPREVIRLMVNCCSSKTTQRSRSGAWYDPSTPPPPVRAACSSRGRMCRIVSPAIRCRMTGCPGRSSTTC